MAGIVLPVESRKRSVFVFKTQNPPRGFTTLVDPTFAKHGLYARAYHGDFFAMTAPAPKDDLHTRDSSIDFALFDEFVRPALANRVVGFEDIELVDSWAGHYEVSTFDQNAFVGRHAKVRLELSSHVRASRSNLQTVRRYATLYLRPDSQVMESCMPRPPDAVLLSSL